MAASLVIAARKSAEGLVGHDVSTGWSMRVEIHAGCKPLAWWVPRTFLVSLRASTSLLAVPMITANWTTKLQPIPHSVFQAYGNRNMAAGYSNQDQILVDTDSS